MRDEPSRLEKTYVAEVARLEIPLRSVVDLRRVGEELRGLAARLDWLSRDRGAPAEVLGEAWSACYKTRRNMARIRAPGRPKKRVHSLRWVRENQDEM